MIDTRLFTHVGTSADSTGVFKARFANGPDARPKILTKNGHTDIAFVELPNPMTKIDAVTYLLEQKPVGVNIPALEEKANYIKTQIAKADGTIPARKRGRPVGSGKKVVVETEGIASKIVKAAKTSRAKTQTAASN